MQKYAIAILLVCAVLFSPPGVAACDHGCHQTGRDARPGHHQQGHHMTTVSNAVAAGTDDGYWITSITLVDFGGAVAGAGFDGGLPDITAAVRFAGVAVPQAPTVSSATLAYTRDPSSTSGAALRVYGEAANNPAAVIDYTDGDARVRTTAFTDIADASVVSSIDVTAQVQEVVNRAGWASGNAMQFFLQDHGATGVLVFDTYEEGTPAHLPTLTITYTTVANPDASGGTPGHHYSSGPGNTRTGGLGRASTNLAPADRVGLTRVSTAQAAPSGGPRRPYK